MILQKINSWKQFSAMHEECALLLLLGYLKDSNAAAHSVDTGIS